MQEVAGGCARDRYKQATLSPTLVWDIKVRIAVGFCVGVDADSPSQFARTSSRGLKQVEVYFGARQRSDAPGEAEGQAGFQHIGDDVAQFVNFAGGVGSVTTRPHATLGHPGGAKANAAGPQG